MFKKFLNAITPASRPELRLKDLLKTEFKEELVTPKHANLFSYYGITVTSIIN